MENEKFRGENYESFCYQRSRAIAWYRRDGISVIVSDGNLIVVKQFDIPKGYIFTNKELYNIGRFWYPDKRYHINPVTFSLDLSIVTPEWIQAQMLTHGLKQKDLKHQIGLSATSLSSIVNGTRNMSTSTKALFFYYFALYAVNKGREGANVLLIQESPDHGPNE